MIKFQVFDSPIENPDNDLFGMATYARKLSNFIDNVKPPFTIGVYGQWGDGKTSFVRLLKFYLGASKQHLPIKFITFSAWPHTTSDAIWRALILCVAKDLYDIKDPAPSKEDDNSKRVTGVGLRQRMVELLKQDAWTPWKPAEVDPHADYHDLISRIDNTAYGAISKNKAEQLQISDQAALMAIVKAGVSAMGSLSPIVAGFRSLFGLDAKLDVVSELNQGKNISTRKLIESVDGFKDALNGLFEKTAQDKRVFVFIDDLDRCLPDVALDLLEATKIFFEDVRCIFIVAADENLIGQGLRLRFKELLGTNEEVKMETFIAQKGKEYFEKIIQFPIRVPPRTTAQGHGFISAQFPQWTPATDIIQTALGINPRRLIQYCNLLSYKYEVYRMQSRLGKPGDTVKQDETSEYLDKLIALYSWSSESFIHLNRLLAGPDKFKENVEKLEHWVNKSTKGNPLPEAEEELKACGCDELYRRSVASTPIFNLMKSDPLFSQGAPELLCTFLRMADIEPSPGKSMLQVRDSVFSRILAVVEEQGQTSARKLLIDDLTKIITFDRSYSPLARELFAFANHNDWTDQLKLIEENLAGVEEATPAIKLNESATRFLENLKTSAASDPNLGPLFLSSPRFSSITPQEILLYEQVRNQLKSAKTALNENFKSATGTERYSRNAVLALEEFPQAEREKLEAMFQLQADSALSFLELRKFAKLDALAFKWPDLADKLRADVNSFIRTYETPANEPITANLDSAIRVLFQQEDRLRDFLRLRPLFSAILDRELTQYFAVAQVVVQASDLQPPTPVPPSAPVPAPVPAPAVIPAQAVPAISYENLTLRVISTADDKYQLIVGEGAGAVSEEITLTSGEVAELNAAIQNLYLYRSGTRQIQQESFLLQDPSKRLTEIGALLYHKLFKSRVELAFLKTIDTARSQYRKVRFVLELTEGLPSLIPWEALYIPSMDLFPALTAQGFSMVRWFDHSQPLMLRTMHSPLRILLAIATPNDAPYLDVRRERAMVEESLQTASKNGQVKLLVLEHATKDGLLEAFRYRPHIFHFIGHGVLQRESEEFAHGALVLEHPDGATDLLSGNSLKMIMGADSSLSLAVLNSCESGAVSAGDAISGVAQTLVKTGTPAVIATTRVILDQTALMFTKEFYRSFVDGFPLEFSLVEARKNLSINQADWTTYALFSGKKTLEDIKLAPN